MGWVDQEFQDRVRSRQTQEHSEGARRMLLEPVMFPPEVAA